MNSIMRHTFTTMRLNEQLRYLRKRNRKSQTVVGDLIGLSSRTIRAFETAERVPDIATLSMLIEELCFDNEEASVVYESWQSVSRAYEVRV